METRGTVNPYMTAYCVVIDMVLGRASVATCRWVPPRLPEVLSNTIVSTTRSLIGRRSRGSCRTLRERSLLLLPKLLTITRPSRPR